jgi:putative ABC transport system substrate-binding protein
MTTRRRFLGFALLSWAGAMPQGLAQEARVAKIGILGVSDADPHFTEAFLGGLRELGHVQGRTFTLELRSAAGRFERLPALAEELALLRPDVILTASTPGVRAARAATSTIPIVVATMGDPVEQGFAVSFARPGRNVTGLANLAGQTIVKQLEMALAMVPGATRIGYLGNVRNPAHVPTAQMIRTAAERTRVTLLVLSAGTAEEIQSAYAEAAREGTRAMVVGSDPFLVSQRQLFAELQMLHRLPSVFSVREHAEAGGLASYGPDYAEQFRLAAGYVDRILKGAKPGDLPIEMPKRLELVVNLRAAKALGLLLPQGVLLRADRVIE